MNKEDFKNEIDKYMASIFDKSEYYQGILCEIYNEFYRVCKLHNIQFYMAFGTLLGAVRDNTMLPWDMDLDVLLPITEKDALIKALEKDLSSEYYYVSPDNTPHHPISFIRICKKGCDSFEFHVDVYYLLGAPSDDVSQKHMQKRLKKVFKERIYKYRDVSDIKKRSKIIYYMKILQNHIYGFCPLWLLNRRLDKLFWQNDYDKSDYVIVVGDGAEVFPKEVFKTTYEKIINGCRFIIPQGSDEFLTIRYGNYKSYLPISNRFEEFYNGYKRKRDVLNE